MSNCTERAEGECVRSALQADGRASTALEFVLRKYLFFDIEHMKLSSGNFFCHLYEVCKHNAFAMLKGPFENFYFVFMTISN